MRERFIPLEITADILLHLPVKSLLRFSSVSKSWRATIFDPEFVSRRGGAGERRMAVLRFTDYPNASSCALPSESEPLIEDAREVVFPIRGKPAYILWAFCDQLWCVQVEDSLFLWSPPSSSAYRKLADPSITPSISNNFQSVFGLGYDSPTDDYKILHINGYPSSKPELYSLRSDSWRTINQPLGPRESSRPLTIVFVEGAFYWIIHPADYSRSLVIVSFDVSTDKYDAVVHPAEFDRQLGGSDLELARLEGKLGLYWNYGSRFILWMMEDDGVKKSWSKKYDIEYGNRTHCFFPRYRCYEFTRFRHRPFYFSRSGRILVEVTVEGGGMTEIFMYDEEEATPKRIPLGYSDVCQAFVYEESLLSTALWPANMEMMRS